MCSERFLNRFRLTPVLLQKNNRGYSKMDKPQKSLQQFDVNKKQAEQQIICCSFHTFVGLNHLADWWIRVEETWRESFVYNYTPSAQFPVQMGEKTIGTIRFGLNTMSNYSKIREQTIRWPLCVHVFCKHFFQKSIALIQTCAAQQAALLLKDFFQNFLLAN